MKAVVVLGSGRMGTTIARDLSPDYSITVVDSNPEALASIRKDLPEIRVEQLELTGELDEVDGLLEQQDLAVVALPGLIAYPVVESLVRHRRPVVDISFFPDSPTPLDGRAREEGIPVAVDCGLAPGLCNLLLGRHLTTMDVSEYRCLVGGLPVRRTLPFQYKAPFSPRDVIEEYTRPVHVRRNGQEIVLPPLSEPEHVDFLEVGTLEAFNTDGLRTLLETTRVPTMIEKTLRYPGHRDQIEFLRQAGFLDSRKRMFGSSEMSPLEVTASMLEEAWLSEPDEADITLMRVEISGTEAGRSGSFRYELVDRFDSVTRTTSMSRATGFTCAAVARLMLERGLVEPGLWTLERIGQDQGFADFVLGYLAKRGVEIRGGWLK